MNTSKKIAVVVLMVAAALFGFLLVRYQRRSDDAEQTYQQMFSLMASGVANWSWNQNWVIDAIGSVLSGQKSIDKSYLVNGKVTKPGALMAIYAASVADWSLDGEHGHENKALTEQLYKIFHDYQARNTII